jgi:tRNA threonylcarbamoyladenosine biosynthesis protein TsaB
MVREAGERRDRSRVLAVDTCTTTCGVGVINGRRGRVGLVFESKETHTRHLMAMVDQALAAVDLAIDKIDLLAVTRGPGSFTGLRIGISTVMGLRAVTKAPAAGVSSLEVLARQGVGVVPWVVPMIDARRDEVYFSLFQTTEAGVVPVTKEQVGAPTQVTLPDERPALFIGNGADAYRIQISLHYGRQAHFAPSISNTIYPLTVAECALQRHAQNALGPYEDLTPIYLRKSDAEINRRSAGH